MKLALNGALTIGTMDGANVEMAERIGKNNMFIFGLDAHDVAQRQTQGVNGREVVASSPALQGVVDSLLAGVFSHGDGERFRPIVDALYGNDWFMVASDFDAYAVAQSSVDKLWADKKRWTEVAIINSVNMGWFSSDRTIRDYAREIWNIPVN
jgi:glycogen phosphorylase